MAKDTLKALDQDVERLLFAGAQIARGDADLLSHKEKLAPLAAKVPAIGKVVEGVDKVQRASGKAAATELLNLAALMAQIRGAQAAPATASGDLTALPPAEKIGTPLGPTELTSLVHALTNHPEAQRRQVVLRVFAERGAVRDLRVVPLAVKALSDGGIHEVVEQHVLPAIGKAAVPDLLARLDLAKGRSSDLRVLRTIARILGAEAKPLLIEAIQKGTAELRALAITELAAIDAEAAEPIALGLARSERSFEVRGAALSTLARSTNDAALEALLDALQKSKTRRYAAEALAVSRHPRVTERLVALFTPELRALGPFKIKRATTDEERKEAAKAEKAHNEQVDHVRMLVDLIGTRGTEETSRLAFEVFKNHRLKAVRGAAGLALLKVGYQDDFDELSPALYEAEADIQRQFVSSVLRLDPARAYDRLDRFFDDEALKKKGGVELAHQILAAVQGRLGESAATELADDSDDGPPEKLDALEREPRWIKRCIRLLPHPDLRLSALDLLTHAQAPEILEALIRLSSARLKGYEAYHLIRALAAYRDPRVVRLLVELLDSCDGYWARRQSYRIIGQYDDPAVAPILRGWLFAHKRKIGRSDIQEIEDILKVLERDRTAASA
jgi:hypothetical protein